MNRLRLTMCSQVHPPHAQDAREILAIYLVLLVLLLVQVNYPTYMVPLVLLAVHMAHTYRLPSSVQVRYSSIFLMSYSYSIACDSPCAKCSSTSTTCIGCSGNTPYLSGSTCVAACSSELPYLSSTTCMVSCPDGSYESSAFKCSSKIFI